MKALLIATVAVVLNVVSMHATAAPQLTQPEPNAMYLKCKRCDCCRVN